MIRDAKELARKHYKASTPKDILLIVAKSDSYRITTIQRLREMASRLPLPGLNHALRVIQTAIYGIELNKDIEIGNGVYFIHPIGVVVGGNAKIGDRVRFYGNNTIGTANENGYPIIEEDVSIGAGARILGPIRVGARSFIGANAVVLEDVPPDSIAVGVPAKIRPRALNNVAPSEKTEE